MAYEVEDFCRDCKSAIEGYRGKADLDAVRGYLEKLLKNEDFLNEHCGPGAEVGTHTLYRDPDTDFMLLAHIQDAGRTSPPHDHGATKPNSSANTANTKSVCASGRYSSF